MKASPEKQSTPKNNHLQQDFFKQSSADAFFGPNTIQPKLTIGQPNDKYEQEADAMAEQVVRGNAGSTGASLGSPQVQTMCADCAEEQGMQRKSAEEEPQEEAPAISKKEEEEKPEISKMAAEEEPQEEAPALSKKEQEEEKPTLQTKPLLMRKTQNGASVGTPALASQLSSSRGGGQTLPHQTNQEMSQAFGADFSQVRIHTDSRSEEMNQGLSARAFTHGSDIYFNRGEYNPGSTAGKTLLAHELTHVVQQNGAKGNNKIQRALGDGHDLNSPRFSGNPELEAAFDNESVIRRSSSGVAVQLIQQALVDSGFPLPRFGVDGKFGTETESALRNYQTAHGLGADGIVGPETMSDLDQRFSPVPILPEITSETTLPAPDGTANDRTEVGVGEEIIFTGNVAGRWTSSAGMPRFQNGLTFAWTAPNRENTVTIQLEVGGVFSTLTIHVIEPSRITADKISEIAIPAGQAGAGMTLTFIYHPLSVSFGNIQVKEVSGPATNITGFFRRKYTNADLRHDSGDRFTDILDDNRDSAIDTASITEDNRRPFSRGTFDWVIPNKFRVDTERGDGKQFTTVLQAFLMVDGSGRIILTKAGQSVDRTP
jgi:hypothetical protein